MNSEKGVAVAWHLTPFKQASDLFERDFVVGGAGVNAESVIFPNAVNRVLSTRFKVVSGYQGSAEMVLAMERGEVQGIGNWHYSSILANRPDWLRDKKLNLLLQLGTQPASATAGRADRDGRGEDAGREGRPVARLRCSNRSGGRCSARPTWPPNALAILRKTFDTLIRDPQFLAEAARRKIEISEPMRRRRCAAHREDLTRRTRR